jgi:hypothetical protein
MSTIYLLSQENICRSIVFNYIKGGGGGRIDSRASEYQYQHLFQRDSQLIFQHHH